MLVQARFVFRAYSAKAIYESDVEQNSDARVLELHISTRMKRMSKSIYVDFFESHSSSSSSPTKTHISTELNTQRKCHRTSLFISAYSLAA